MLRLTALSYKPPGILKLTGLSYKPPIMSGLILVLHFFKIINLD